MWLRQKILGMVLTNSCLSRVCFFFYFCWIKIAVDSINQRQMWMEFWVKTELYNSISEGTKGCKKLKKYLKLTISLNRMNSWQVFHFLNNLIPQHTSNSCVRVCTCCTFSVAEYSTRCATGNAISAISWLHLNKPTHEQWKETRNIYQTYLTETGKLNGRII